MLHAPQFAVRPVTDATRQQRYDDIAQALRDSVAKHMRADVTVGSFLSGGIDSTAIAALAIQHNPDLITFTTGFQREGYSEVDVAAESAEAIGARHVIKVVGPDEFIASIPEIVWYLDDPVADPALVPLYFVAKEARKHVKVVLSGEGADELFGGYTIYKEPLSLSTFDKISKLHAIDPPKTAFFEDSEKNLAPAALLGMTTVLVGAHAAASTADFVHHRTHDLAGFLTSARLKEA